MVCSALTILLGLGLSAVVLGTAFAFPDGDHGHGGYGGGHGGHGGHGSDVDYHAHPSYKFEYSVHDPHSKDVKSQWEHRDGDVVKGFYTVKEADGSTREVHYTSDKKNGFNAVVKKHGHGAHPHVYGGHGEGHGHGHGHH
ncbi:cuticle protein 19 isoform X1 [Halyomorpha halys]|uniref:cuticle protein 19 isoform X1 n=1 Tax=Halyomorpha halys TaxID=286706 RepID=UPI0006D4DF5B|nr:cuticle protein 19-like [Halyomorpha halys]